MRIAVLCLPGIGDSLMATPMVHLLRKKIPHATIDLICMFDGVAYCFKQNKDIDHIYRLTLYNAPLVKGILEILNLRRNSYDYSILAFPAYRREYHIVQFLLGAKKRISHTFSKGFWHKMNFLDTIRIPVDEKMHNTGNNLSLLQPLGISQKDFPKKLQYALTLDPIDIKFAKEYIKKLDWENKKIIGIHPGSIDSSAGVYKRWPVENFAKLITTLIAKKKKILIFVGPFEQDLGKKIMKLMQNNKNCRIVEKTSFGQTLGILAFCKVLISNDNGFAHIANALHIKGIVLFGPTNPLWCCPIDRQCATWIRKAKFTPWFRNDMKVTHPPRGIHSGMQAISTDDVLTALTKKE